MAVSSLAFWWTYANNSTRLNVDNYPIQKIYDDLKDQWSWCDDTSNIKDQGSYNSYRCLNQEWKEWVQSMMNALENLNIESMIGAIKKTSQLKPSRAVSQTQKIIYVQNYDKWFIGVMKTWQDIPSRYNLFYVTKDKNQLKRYSSLDRQHICISNKGKVIVPESQPIKWSQKCYLVQWKFDYFESAAQVMKKRKFQVSSTTNPSLESNLKLALNKFPRGEKNLIDWVRQFKLKLDNQIYHEN